MRAGLEEEDICGIIVVKVDLAIRGAISELFGSVKTMLIEEFYRRYVTVTGVFAVVATAVVVITLSQRVRACSTESSVI